MKPGVPLAAVRHASSLFLAITSGRYVFSRHVRVADEIDPQEVLSKANAMLKEGFGFFFVTLQVETACVDETGAEAIDVTRAAGHGR